jgi:hypothetical protein
MDIGEDGKQRQNSEPCALFFRASGFASRDGLSAAMAVR